MLCRRIIKDMQTVKAGAGAALGIEKDMTEET